jgi:glycerate 2-kinase
MSTCLRKDAEDIFRTCLEGVMPARLMHGKLERIDNTLVVDGQRYQLNHNVRIIAFGKAALGMIRAVEDILYDHVVGGYANIPVGAVNALGKSKPQLLPDSKSKVTLNEGAANNIPDKAAEKGARDIYEMACRAHKDDLLIVLISGGGSALLPLTAECIALDEKKVTTGMLSKSGATINELNAVRKHISTIKGGLLARAAAHATVVALMISDVLDDPLDVIASGPTCPDTSTFADALAVLNKYGLSNKVPSSVLNRLMDGEKGILPETPKVGDPAFDRVQNVIIGNNAIAVKAAKDRAGDLGYNTLVLTTLMRGEAREIAHACVAVAREVVKSGSPVTAPACIICSGETTVSVRGKGFGGRNQELALSAAMDLDACKDILLLSGATDGQDGPTDAAGAFADGDTIRRAEALGLDAVKYLQRNDSYNFFSKLDDLFFTGLTGTNVMDIQIILVR